jgi:hypothetical protein
MNNRVFFFLHLFVLFKNEALKQNGVAQIPTSIFRISQLPISILNSNRLIEVISTMRKEKTFNSLDPSKSKLKNNF